MKQRTLNLNKKQGNRERAQQQQQRENEREQTSELIASTNSLTFRPTLVCAWIAPPHHNLGSSLQEGTPSSPPLPHPYGGEKRWNGGRGEGESENESGRGRRCGVRRRLGRPRPLRGPHCAAFPLTYQHGARGWSSRGCAGWQSLGCGCCPAWSGWMDGGGRNRSWFSCYCVWIVDWSYLTHSLFCLKTAACLVNSHSIQTAYKCANKHKHTCKNKSCNMTESVPQFTSC